MSVEIIEVDGTKYGVRPADSDPGWFVISLDGKDIQLFTDKDGVPDWKGAFSGIGVTTMVKIAQTYLDRRR